MYARTADISNESHLGDAIAEGFERKSPEPRTDVVSDCPTQMVEILNVMVTSSPVDAQAVTSWTGVSNGMRWGIGFLNDVLKKPRRRCRASREQVRLTIKFVVRSSVDYLFRGHDRVEAVESSQLSTKPSALQNSMPSHFMPAGKGAPWVSIT